MNLFKTSALAITLILAISPAIAKEKVNNAYKDRDKYNFEPAPMEPIRKIKTKVVVKTIKGKEVKVKEPELKKLLKAINILIDNNRKIDQGKISVHWYKKVKNQQYEVIKNIVDPPANSVFKAPMPPPKGTK